MAVRVRLTRVGSKKNAIWRVVVADRRSPRDGRFIEMIGHYNPQTQPSQIVIDEERLRHWLDRGAEPSNTVKKLMRAQVSGAGVADGEPAGDPGEPGAAVGEGDTAAAAAAEDGDTAATEAGDTGATSTGDTAATEERALAQEGDTAAEEETAAAPDGSAEDPDAAAPDDPAAEGQ